ncbi:MAG: FAD-dependent oxidoreductase, partial [Desulfobacteraceae bacterium]|nr:FAD-dependent oxidoreductase [Desulfobacteraceae bacterium]
VRRIDPLRKVLQLEGHGEIAYDAVSFNTGSDVPPITGGDGTERVLPVKPIVNLYRARQWLMGAARGAKLRLFVLGGGAAGVEVAGNLHALLRRIGASAAIGLIAGREVLRGHPARVRRLALESLKRRGIEIREGTRVEAVRGEWLILSDGEKMRFDLAFSALGVRPSEIFADSGLPTGPDGGLLIDEYLKSVAYPEIFGGGDCISLAGRPLAKVGVYAVRENPVLYANLKAVLNGEALVPFRPGGGYLLILNMGDGKGILWRNGLVWSGRTAFLIKDCIDRRFMRRFRPSGG